MQNQLGKPQRGDSHTRPTITNNLVYFLPKLLMHNAIVNSVPQLIFWKLAPQFHRDWDSNSTYEWSHTMIHMLSGDSPAFTLYPPPLPRENTERCLPDVSTWILNCLISRFSKSKFLLFKNYPVSDKAVSVPNISALNFIPWSKNS